MIDWNRKERRLHAAKDIGRSRREQKMDVNPMIDPISTNTESEMSAIKKVSRMQ